MKVRSVIALFLFWGCIQGQGGFRSRIYLPGAPNHQAKAIFETSPGSYFAAGFAWDTAGSPQAINMLTVMGLNNSGSLQWYKQYGSLKFFYKNNIFVSRSYYKLGNHIYYTGCAQDTTNKQIGVLIKFDLNGDTVWQRVFRDPDPQEDVIPQMVTASVDGGFLITGFFEHWGGNGRRGMLIKTDANGHELWRKKISKSAPNVQDGKAIIQDSTTKKIVIVGYQYKTQPGSYGNVLVLDSLGNELNRQGFIQGQLTDLAQLPDKSFITCGVSSWQDAQNLTWYQGYAAKFQLNTGSSPDWKYKHLPSSKNSGIGCLRILANGNLLTMGAEVHTDSIHYMDNNLILATIIDLSGNIKWSRTYNYKTNVPTAHFHAAVRSVEPTSDGGWIAAIELSTNQHPNPFFFVKYDSTGCDSTTVYCQSVITGLQETNSVEKTSFSMFPNPAGSLLEFHFAGMLHKKYVITISDVVGKQVKTFKDIFPGQKADVSDLPEGVYFVSLVVNEKTRSLRKLVIQR